MLRSEHISGQCKTFKKITKGLGFHPKLKTAVLQSIVGTTLPAATFFNVHSIHRRLFVRTNISLIPSLETQSDFNNSIKNSFGLAFDSRTTVRRVDDTQLE